MSLTSLKMTTNKSTSTDAKFRLSSRFWGFRETSFGFVNWMQRKQPMNRQIKCALSVQLLNINAVK